MAFYGVGKGFYNRTGFTEPDRLPTINVLSRPEFTDNNAQLIRNIVTDPEDYPMPFGDEGTYFYVTDAGAASDTASSNLIFGGAPADTASITDTADWHEISFFNLVKPAYKFKFYSGGVFNIVVPKRTFAFTELVVSNGTFRLGVPKRAFKFYESQDAHGTFNLTFPRRVFNFSGSDDTLGAFNIVIPRRRFNFQNLPENTYVFVMNTDTGAGPTLYTSWDWDSGIEVNGDIYVADSTGLYKVTGLLDKGVTNIDSYIVIPESDLGVSEMKNMSDAFVGVQGGPIALQTFHDSSYSSVHTMNDTTNEIVTKRCKLGLGIRQRYWGVKVASVNGADWKIDSIELNGIVCSRKINQK